MMGLAVFFALTLAAASTDGGSSPSPAPVDAGAAGSTSDAGVDAGATLAASPAPPLPLPPVREVPAAPLSAAVAPSLAPPQAAVPKRGKTKSSRQQRGVFPDVILEAQNHVQAIARRYAQLLMAKRFDEARLLHEEEGGRRPDWNGLRTAAASFIDLHGSPRTIEQSLTTYFGAELTTFFFTAIFLDGSELPIRVAVDHWGHVSGAGVGGELVAATKKRYDRYDFYKTRTELSLPFDGVWMASNATLAPGNGHYLNANQRFAVDFFIVSDSDSGKAKSHRDHGNKNTDYFSYGQDVLSPAEGLVVQVVDGVPDNPPGQTDVYYRLGNSIVLSFENGEYGHLCHLMPGSIRVRPGDRVLRGQVLAKCGNSGNSTGPHLHFQLTDGPQISHAASLPAYFHNVQKNGALLPEVLPQSGDRLANAKDGDHPYHADADATEAPSERHASSRSPRRSDP